MTPAPWMIDWLRLHLVFRALLRFPMQHPARALIVREVQQCLRLRRVLMRDFAVAQRDERAFVSRGYHRLLRDDTRDCYLR